MRSLVVSESDKIAALMEDNRAQDFFIARNDLGMGDVYTVKVENIMPSIDAVFVNLGGGRMGFLHANDVPGGGGANLEKTLVPGQKLLVQIVKEPTGKKGPRVDLNISLPGRYFVLTTDNNSVAISRRISDSEERDRLKSIANLMKPEEIGLVIRTEAAGRTEAELEEDFVNLWTKWRFIVDKNDNNKHPGSIYKEQDFLYSILRDAFNSDIDEIVVDSMGARRRCEQFLKTWTGREIGIRHIEGGAACLQETNVEKELRNCLHNRVDLPSGGYLVIQTTEALTAIDINSGRFTSSSTLRETVRRTNMEAAVEIARQMRLRNIGGMIIVDFIDMYDRTDRIKVMETLESAVKADKSKPQVGQLSDLCLVELTRKRSGQALREVFGVECQYCDGLGINFSLRGSTQQVTAPRNDRGGRGGRDRNERGGRDRNERGGRNNRDRNDRRNNRNDRNDRNERSDWKDKKSSRHKNKEESASVDSADEVKDLTESKTFSATHAVENEELTKPADLAESNSAEIGAEAGGDTAVAVKTKKKAAAASDDDSGDEPSKRGPRRVKASKSARSASKRRSKK